MDPTPSRTEELLKQARDGDPHAVESLLALHRNKLKQMVRVRMDTRLMARLDPSDIVQEALIEANRRLPIFLERNDDLFYPWIRSIAWERLVQMHRKHLGARKRSVHREVELDLPNSSATEFSQRLAAHIATPSRILMREELRQRVRRYLDTLNPRDKEILLMRHLELLPMNEIAGVLEISLSAAQSRYRRALERLHESIGDDSGS